MIIDNRYEVIPNSQRQGGQAVVYECIDLADDLSIAGKRVAVKVTNLETSLAARSHERDVKSLKRLNHDNIIELLDWGAQNNQGFVVMPLLAGNLEEYLNKNHNLKNSDKMRQIIVPVIGALSYAHENGVAHRDLKLRNILVDEYGTPFVTDFGAAKVYGPQESEFTQVHWRSGSYTPEITGTGYQHDVYSIGILIIVIVTGKYPKNLEEALILLNSKSNEKNSIFSDETKKIVEKCIEIEPKNRYADAIELYSEIIEREKKRQMTKNEKDYLACIRLEIPQTRNLLPLQEKFPNLNAALSAQFSEGQEIYAYPSKNDRDGTIRKNEFWLITDRLQLLLRPNSQANGWNVVDAKLRDSQDLEVKRNNGYALSKLGIKWAIHKNIPDVPRCTSGFKKISSELAEWLNKGAPIESGTLYVEQDVQYLAGKWLKILDARVDVATVNFKPLRFRDAKIDGLRIFLKLEDPEFSENTNIELEGSFWKIQFNRPELAEVVTHLGNEVELLLGREPRGHLKPSGQLIPEVEQGLASQIKRQRDAVNQVLNRLSFNPKLGDYLARLGETGKVNPILVNEWQDERLDDSKKIAVSKALGTKDFLLVKGPPGTGKTSFIAEYVYQEMKRDPNVKILLVSQTHVALDNALQRLQKNGITGCVRLGLSDDARISESSKKLLVDVQMREWMLQLRQNSNQFIEREAIKAGVGVEEARALLTVREIIQIQKTIHQIESEEIEEEKYTVEQETVNQMSLTNSEILQLKRKEEQRLVELLSNQLDGKLTIPQDYSKMNFEDFEGALIGKQELSAHFMDVVDTQAKWLDRVGSSRQLTPIFLQTRRLLAGTCIGFMSMPEVRDLNFDICIIDEASRATIPQALVSMVKADKWIIVGDSNQLSPSEIELRGAEAAEILKEYEIQLSDTEESIFSFLEDSLPAGKQVILNTQYRMRNEIGQMVSSLFYQNEISSSGPEIDEKQKLVLRAVEWSDTANLPQSEKSEFRDNLSFSNRNEINEIHRCLTALRNSLEKEVIKIELLPIEKNSKLKVLIIAPYSAQVIMAKTIIGNTAVYPFEVEFNSIDAVQGREADIVFFSCVRSNDNQEVGFMGHKNWRRINVALSRARLKVHIVGDAYFWQNTKSALSDVISYLKDQKTDQFYLRDLADD